MIVDHNDVPIGEVMLLSYDPADETFFTTDSPLWATHLKVVRKYRAGAGMLIGQSTQQAVSTMIWLPTGDQDRRVYITTEQYQRYKTKPKATEHQSEDYIGRSSIL